MHQISTLIIKQKKEQRMKYTLLILSLLTTHVTMQAMSLENIIQHSERCFVALEESDPLQMIIKGAQNYKNSQAPLFHRITESEHHNKDGYEVVEQCTLPDTKDFVRYTLSVQPHQSSQMSKFVYTTKSNSVNLNHSEITLNSVFLTDAALFCAIQTALRAQCTELVLQHEDFYGTCHRKNHDAIYTESDSSLHHHYHHDSTTEFCAYPSKLLKTSGYCRFLTQQLKLQASSNKELPSYYYLPLQANNNAPTLVKTPDCASSSTATMATLDTID